MNVEGSRDIWVKIEVCLPPAAQAPADDADQGHVVVLHTHQGAARVTLQKGEEVSCVQKCRLFAGMLG